MLKTFWTVLKGTRKDLPYIYMEHRFNLSMAGLLNIPSGGLSTFGAIAKYLKNSLVSRAVGTDVGSNPVTIRFRTIYYGHWLG